ncbi:MAG: T9SS type A sorting domain-containing protein [Bacteroidales bacterium]|nr:T9SS type A sorting domain-containing protein [Bacteroidales bacterium]
MNRSLKSLTGYILGLALLPGLHAQEVITPLFGNPQASEHHKGGLHLKKSTGSTLLDLPLFDDFSNTSVVPDTGIWSDAYAFINNNYCVDPVSNGVATLDALDYDGSIYPHAVLDPSTFIADHLTSHPIQLDAPASDSIYLSFMYQPKGLGNRPEIYDSLLVDFFDPGSGEWINVWGLPGDTLHPFMHAMIPVTDPRFLTTGFRFRFRNRASLSRNKDYPDKRVNADHWNVDYVRLDRNRFAADTVLRDVTFITSIPSMLKDLSSLPWAHFNQAYNMALNSPISIRYRNNDTITRNVTRSWTIHDLIHNETNVPGSPTAQDLPAMTDTVVDFDFFFPFDSERGDSAIIRFKAALRTDEFDPKQNDTVVYDQVFKDFYAYDDGTAEAGYGLRGQGTRNGSVAMKYYSYVPDLLGGVDIYFNHVYDSINLDYYFKLMVWDESEGIPGSIIWEDENDHTPEYTSTYPGFKRYHFSYPVQVSETFYVGWKQYNEYMLNVGLDLNNKPVPSVMYYNYQGIWQPSEAPGVILFRPFLYDETTGENQTPNTENSLHIYPNPASDRIFFTLPEVENPTGIQVELFDASGRLANRSVIHSGSMDISSFPAGIYYIRAHHGKTIYNSKLLINR